MDDTWKLTTCGVCRLTDSVGHESTSRLGEAAALLLDVADMLLNAFAAALSATDTGRQRSLQMAYSAAKASVLPPLLRLTLTTYGTSCAAAAAISSHCTAVLLEPLISTPLTYSAHMVFRIADAPIGQEYMQRVESLAEAHYGYAQLVEIADFLEDKTRLVRHMHSLTGDARVGIEPMATFVFQ